jgi:hypothetical protein
MVKERPISFKAPMVRAILEDRKTLTRRIVKPPRGWESQYPHCDPFAMPPAVWWWNGIHERVGVRQECPYGKPGDRLWVRENYWIATNYSYGTDPCGEPVKTPPPSQLHGNPIHFAADGNPPNCANSTYGPNGLRGGHFAAPDPYAIWDKHPSIHMPRWASRILLEIINIKVERLQDICEDEAKAEGARRFDELPSIHPFGIDSRWSMESPKSTDQCLGSARMAFANYFEKINGEESWCKNPWVWVIEFRRIRP